MSFSEMEYSLKSRKSKKEEFLEKMEKVVPLGKWCELIQPYYYERGNGRPPIDLDIMLKIYLVSCWYNLSDDACEDMIHDSLAVKNYVKGVADATTLGKFRKLLHDNGLTEKIFKEQTDEFKANGIILHEGSVLDATIVDAPRKSPEIGCTYKYGQRRFGIKAHIATDKKGIVHNVLVTPANVQEITVAHEILHGNEQEIYGDAGYVGLQKRPEICEKYQDGSGEIELVKYSTNKKYLAMKKNPAVKFMVNLKKKSVTDPKLEKSKTKIRARVEHVFLTMKHIFKYRRVRYRTLSKNSAHIHMLLALVNLTKI